MRPVTIRMLLVAAGIALPLAVNAQTSTQSDTSAREAQRASGQQQYGEGGSKHCDQLAGAKKQECLQDEGAKTDRKQEPAAAAPEVGKAGERSSASGGDAATDAKGDNATQTND